MPRHDGPINAMGGEYVPSFGGSASSNIWLSGTIAGVGTVWYTAHPLGLGVPNVVIIPFIFGGTVFAGTLSATNVPGSIGVTATQYGTYKILALM